jgi:Lrp/AsnC family leucine-responsive transcriptional regulator
VTPNTAKRIDAIDPQLLSLLQRDALKPARVLAQALHISISSVQRRIRDLRQRGVIERIAALVEPSLVGRPVTIIVDVCLEKEDVRSVNELKRLMRDTPEVIHCYHVTGDHTFVMISRCRAWKRSRRSPNACSTRIARWRSSDRAS